MAAAGGQVSARCNTRRAWPSPAGSHRPATNRRMPMAHLIQVGAGSGGMPVLDLLCREPRIARVTLIEPDIYKPHNVDRHVFPLEAIGEPKAELAQRWLKERRADLEIAVLPCDLLDPAAQQEIE